MGNSSQLLIDLNSPNPLESVDLSLFSVKQLEKIQQNLGRVNDNIIDKKSIKLESMHSLEAFSKTYLDMVRIRKASKTYTSYKSTMDKLCEYFPNYDIRDIGVIDAENFILCESETAPKGVSVYYRNAKAAFNVAIKWKLITENPFNDVDPPKKNKSNPVFLTEQELEMILSAETNEIFKNIFAFAFYTGLRLGEILNLEWDRVDLVNSFITVGSEKHKTKSRTNRKVPMAQMVKDLLIDLNDRNQSSVSKSDYVFVKANGFRYTEVYISKRFKKIIRKLKLSEEYHFHTLRHSFASYLVQKKVDLYSVKELMGHSSISTTQIYAHLNTEKLFDAISVFNKDNAA